MVCPAVWSGLEPIEGPRLAGAALGLLPQRGWLALRCDVLQLSAYPFKCFCGYLEIVSQIRLFITLCIETKRDITTCMGYHDLGLDPLASLAQTPRCWQTRRR
jgi:hypothetical protein